MTANGTPFTGDSRGSRRYLRYGMFSAISLLGAAGLTFITGYPVLCLVIILNVAIAVPLLSREGTAPASSRRSLKARWDLRRQWLGN